MPHSQTACARKTGAVRSRRTPAAVCLLAVSAAVLLGACNGKKQETAPTAPPEVSVLTMTPHNISLPVELPGRLEASRMAEIRARVSGILLGRQFEEGSDVKAGQLLFRIDDAPYKATLQSAEASVAQTEASLIQAQALARRYEPLVAANAVSRQDYDDAVAAVKVAEANLAAARASVTSARINLDYASVISPISGRIGRALVTEGALVGQGEATHLAVVQQIDPLYVNFTQPASDALKLRADIAAGKYRVDEENAATINVILEDGSLYPHTGRLLFTDLTVDPTTGQVTLRAEVPNPDKSILPGLYVRVRLEQAMLENGFLVPQQAVTRSDRSDAVSIVEPDNTLTTRNIRLGPSVGSSWVVLDGLREGDRVMVEGFQRVNMARGRMKPGEVMKVNPKPWTPAGTDNATTQPTPAQAGNQQ